MSGRLFATVATSLATVVLVIAAVLVTDPLSFPFRGTLAVAVVLTATAIAATVRRRWPSIALALVSGATVWAWSAPWRDARAVWAELPEARVAGRHFVVGYTELSDIKELSRAGLIGGVFLTRRNVAGRDAAAVATEIAALQAERLHAGLPPLIVAGDQEGGPVTHLSPPLPPVPALSLLAPLPREASLEAARREGAEAGRALAALGITMDLAPVVDLRPAVPPTVLDLHTRIASRAVSNDPDTVASVASGFASGLHDAGVTPTAKHFPGLGSVASDTHLFGATLATPRAGLSAADWRPFRAVMAVPGAAVMMSHVSLEAIDPGVPASRSRRVVDGLLRGEWGFDGLVITDDLTMGAVVHAGICRAVEGALNAGVDLVLVSWDTDKIYPALRCAADATRGGRLDAAALARSAVRLDHARPRDGETNAGP